MHVSAEIALWSRRKFKFSQAFSYPFWEADLSASYNLTETTGVSTLVVPAGSNYAEAYNNYANLDIRFEECEFENKGGVGLFKSCNDIRFKKINIILSYTIIRTQ